MHESHKRLILSSGLGDELRVFTARTSGYMIAAIFFLILGSLPFILFAMFSGPGEFNSTGLGCGAVALLIGLNFLLLRWLPGRDSRVFVYQKGIVVQKRRRLYSARWDEVESTGWQLYPILFKGLIYWPGAERYILYLNNSRKVIIGTAYPDFDRIETSITSAISHRLRPSLDRDLKNGEWISFKSIEVHRDGVKIRGKIFKWTDFVWIQRHTFRIEFRRAPSWKLPISVPVTELRNDFMLIPYLRQLSGNRLRG